MTQENKNELEPKVVDVAKAEVLSESQEPQGSGSEKAPSVGPMAPSVGHKPSSVLSAESRATASVRLPPIEKSGFRTGTWPTNNEYLLSGVGKAYFEHRMGRYWDIMRTSNIKC